MIDGTPREALRVLQVIGSFEGGGAQRQAFNLVLGLDDLGVNVLGVAVRRLGDFVRWNRWQSKFVELGADRHRPLTLLRAAYRFRLLVRRWRPDAIHVQGSDTLPFVCYALRGTRNRPRIFFTWQDSGRVLHQQGHARKRMLRALADCEEVFGSSSDVASRLMEAGRLPSVGIFHGGVPESLPARPVAPPLILWIGRLEPAKGPELLVRAASELRRLGVSFRVAMIGRPHPGSSYFEELRDLIRQKGLDDLIACPGYVDDEGLESWISQASIGVQSSRTEGLSMALLEQMMRGLAIVATDVGDTSVALDGGRCGILIPREADPVALAGRLEELIRDPELRRTLGGWARERAIAKFSIQAMAQRAHRIYERALRSPTMGTS